MHSFQIKRMEEESTKRSLKTLFKRRKSQSESFNIQTDLNIPNTIISAVLPLFGLLKDKKGKLSSKRTITGILAAAAFQDIEANGLNDRNLILAGLSILPILFTVFERD